MVSEDIGEIGDPTFDLEVIDSSGNGRGALQRLAAGMAAAVKWSGAMASETAGLIVDIGPSNFEAYDPRRLDPPILKVGPAVYDFYLRDHIDESYFDAARKASRQLERMFGEDPVAPLLDRLSRETGASVRPASVGGRPLHVGILREFPAASKIHYDELVREYPRHLDVEPIVQLAFNLHVITPEQGGELTVWKHKWIPHDDHAADGYGWKRELMRHVPSRKVSASAGDGIFFDCRNFHQVADFSGGRRVTLSFFCGFTIGDGIIVWS
jgi:hypothetical protein